MTYVLKKALGKAIEPGEWRASANHTSVICRCPKCGGKASLDHAVNAAGVITPSVQCPYAPCDFHVMGQLEGWEGGEKSLETYP